jgi:mono/diheme cytochrome c family protein
MRELIARGICLLTLVVVVALSVVFALRHNRGTTPVEVIPAPRPERAAVALPDAPQKPTRGQAVFAEQNCAACHSLAGTGNPRYPLDGVGARLSTAELRNWITATGGTAERLPASIARRKQRYQELPAADHDSLVTYLASLGATPTTPGK